MARQTTSIAEVPHAAATRAVRAALAKMSPAELRATMVHAGIHTPEGKLTEAYGGRPVAKKRPKSTGRGRKKVSRRARAAPR